MGRIKLLSELIKAVGKKNKKTLKNTKPTTIRGVNIKTKAGKEFGDKVKNQPKRIAGQDPVGRKPRKMKDGGTVALTNRDPLPSKMAKKGKTQKELQEEQREKRNKEVADKLKIKVFRKDGGALKDIPEGNKGLPKLPTEVRNKMGFKKDGGLVSATAKLKAQGLKDGGPVRGKARGMGAATKGGGYNV